jgi:competence protein ComEA
MKTPTLPSFAALLTLAALPLTARAVDPVAEPVTVAAAEKAKVDLNTASIADLEKLPGVGTEFANAIAAARPFHSVDDLQRVSGFTTEKMKALRDQVTASPVVAPDTKPDTSSTNKTTQPTKVNEGRATDNKAVTERYDQATANQEARIRAIAAGRPPGTPISANSSEAGSNPAQLIPMPSALPGSMPPPVGAAEKPVNINTATRAELEALPEIGPVHAQAVIDARPFISREDFRRVKGLTDATYEVVKNKITVQ